MRPELIIQDVCSFPGYQPILGLIISCWFADVFRVLLYVPPLFWNPCWSICDWDSTFTLLSLQCPATILHVKHQFQALAPRLFWTSQLHLSMHHDLEPILETQHPKGEILFVMFWCQIVFCIGLVKITCQVQKPESRIYSYSSLFMHRGGLCRHVTGSILLAGIICYLYPMLNDVSYVKCCQSWR